MEQFIGCLVSLTCDGTLGMYQGKVDSINTHYNTLTISHIFRDGIPDKLSQLTVRSQDIVELKIIKDADELVENLPTITPSTTTLHHKLPTTTPSTTTHHHNLPTTTPSTTKAQLYQLPTATPSTIHQLYQLPTTTPSTIHHLPTTTSSTIYHLPTTTPSTIHQLPTTTPSTTKPQLYHLPTPTPSTTSHHHNLPNIKTSPMLPSYNSPHKTYASHSTNTPNKNRHQKTPSKHEMQYMAFQYSNLPHPNNYHHDNLNHHHHHPLDNNHHHDNHLLDNNHDKQTRKNKVMASFSEHSNLQNTKQFSRQQRNSECFNQCEGDFDEEFDFESNLALFDKITPLKNNPQNKPQNYPKSLPDNPRKNAQVKYKCNENVIKGVEVSCRQIYFIYQPTSLQFPITFSSSTNASIESTNNSTFLTNLLAGFNSTNSSTTHLSTIKNSKPTYLPSITTIMGEYKTDVGFLVPGVDEKTRDRFLETVVSSAFSQSRLVESYGRSISEAVMQFLGGSARLEPKNEHQKPCITILISSTNHPWISATAINTARALANRSANVKLYIMPSSSSSRLLSSPLFKDEFNLFLATSTGSVVSSFKELDLEHGLDLIISTLTCQPYNYNNNIHNNNNPNNYNNSIQNNSINKNNNNILDTETNQILNKISELCTPTFAIEPSTSALYPIHLKRSFVCAMPLWLADPSYGQVCYCDLGIPDRLYRRADVVYKSPFFDKFFLPLIPHYGGGGDGGGIGKGGSSSSNNNGGGGSDGGNNHNNNGINKKMSRYYLDNDKIINYN